MIIKKQSLLMHVLAISFFAIQFCFCYEAIAHVSSNSHYENLQSIEDDDDDYSYMTSDKPNLNEITEEVLEKLFGEHMPNKDVYEEFIQLIDSVPLLAHEDHPQHHYKSVTSVKYEIEGLKRNNMNAIYSLALSHDLVANIQERMANRYGMSDEEINDLSDLSDPVMKKILMDINMAYASMAQSFLYDIGSQPHDSLVTIKSSGELYLHSKKARTQEEKDLLSSLKHQYSSTMKMYREKEVMLDEAPAFFYVNFYDWVKKQTVKIIMNEQSEEKKLIKTLFYLNLVAVYSVMDFDGCIYDQHKNFIKSVNDIK